MQINSCTFDTKLPLFLMWSTSDCCKWPHAFGSQQWDMGTKQCLFQSHWGSSVCVCVDRTCGRRDALVLKPSRFATVEGKAAHLSVSRLQNKPTWTCTNPTFCAKKDWMHKNPKFCANSVQNCARAMFSGCKCRFKQGEGDAKTTRHSKILFVEQLHQTRTRSHCTFCAELSAASTLTKHVPPSNSLSSLVCCENEFGCCDCWCDNHADTICHFESTCCEQHISLILFGDQTAWILDS